MLNYLKLNFSCTVILFASKENTDFIPAVAALVFMNSIPLFFLFILRRHHNTLADEDNIKSFGTLYAGYNVKGDRSHKIQFLPLSFFYRRLAVVLVTVYLFEYPCLQLISCHIATLLTVVYLTFDSDRFATRA